MKKVNWLILGGSFNNNMDKKRGKGFSRKSTLGHVTKGGLVKISTIVHTP